MSLKQKLHGVAIVAAAFFVGASSIALAADKPLTVGFAQEGAESSWRTANTKSVQDEAAKRGINLKFSDAQQKQENQIRAVRSFITQHVDVIVVPPVVKTGWEPVLKEAKRARIPVIFSDRSASVPEDLYATFIGSDFVEEGRRAGKWLADHTHGKANIAEIQGTVGADPANDRKKGFEEGIKDYPGMKIILSQSGNFDRDGGKKVMEAFLKSPEGKNITAVYAHNDDMALGAIQAIEEAGMKPGKDILIVSIDGVKAAFEAMLAGKLNCTVECTPLLGPAIFDAAEKLKAGQAVPKHIASQESLYDQSMVTPELVASRKY